MDAVQCNAVLYREVGREEGGGRKEGRKEAKKEKNERGNRGQKEKDSLKGEKGNRSQGVVLSPSLSLSLLFFCVASECCCWCAQLCALCSLLFFFALCPQATLQWQVTAQGSAGSGDNSPPPPASSSHLHHVRHGDYTVDE